MRQKNCSSKSAIAPQTSGSAQRSYDPDYSRFDLLDGTHPWRDAVPEGFVLYPVRQLNFGKVAYFNFSLAKEMGLIDQDHPHRMTKKLEKRILETFNLRIINEYDQENKILYPGSRVKPNKYMATRYLQLQHPDKRGLSSGDGRGIWNGTFRNNGTIWDVSSRGTGVTCLAPGAVQAGKPLQSGNTDFGYGCGLAEIDELYASAIMAEIFHNNQINTERMLTIIDSGDGMGIGVRAGTNLTRPAHLFLYLKQGHYDSLKQSTDYLIERQFANGEWRFNSSHRRRYDLLLDEVCESFAQFVAQLDREYIFAWLDWDGDNVLATAGIIDYGSVRQFGIRHDQYRYDDVERFSTTLNEQKAKARLTIQVFAQLVDFLKTKSKKPLPHFKRHPILTQFDKHFKYYLLDHFLYQLGFDRTQRERLLTKSRAQVEDLFRNFSYFERIKTYRKLQKVADGVNRPAVFNMRSWIRETASFLTDNFENKVHQDPYYIFQIMLTTHASRRDSLPNSRLNARIKRLEIQYKNLIKKAASYPAPSASALTDITNRAQVINTENRLTGNGLIHVVSEIMSFKGKGLPHSEIQKALDATVQNQALRPEMAKSQGLPRLHRGSKTYQLMQNILSLVEGYKEDI